MKLVETLVKYCPSWPAKAAAVTQDTCGGIYLWLSPDVHFMGQWVEKTADNRRQFYTRMPRATDHATAIVTREMWEAERRRIMPGYCERAHNSSRTPQPDWSKAPEGADRHGFVGPDRLEIWLNGSQYSYCDSDNGRTFDFGHSALQRRRDSVIGETLRPATPQWRGPEVGDTVEIHKGEFSMRESAEDFIGVPVKVMAAFATDRGQSMIAVDGGPEIGCEVFLACMAHPLRTPRDKWIEAAIEAGASQRNAALIYDAGLAKLPEDGE